MYWILLVIVIFGILQYDFSKISSGRAFLYYTTFALVVFISTFAYNLGTDGPKYQEGFESFVPSLDNFMSGLRISGERRWNIGFYVFASTCKTIIPSFYFFKFVYALIVNGSIFAFFRKNTNHFFLAVFYYLLLQGFYFNFEIYREALAVSIFIWAYPFIEKKKLIKYYLLCTLALLFHDSAIILFMVPFFRFLKVGSKKTLIIMIIINIVLIVISAQLLDILGNVLTMDKSLESDYSNYLESDFYAMNRFSLSDLTTWATLVVDVAIPIVMLYVMPREGNTKDYFPLIYIAVLLVIPAKAILILYRFSNYIFVFKALFYIEMFKFLSIKFVSRRRYYLILISVLFLYVGYFFYAKNFSANYYGFRGIDRFYPYVSIFGEM